MAQISQNDQRDPKTYAILGAAMEVHKRMGSGFLEAVYHEALALEFAARAIPFRSQVELPVFYRGHRLNTTYRADFVCFDSIIVELKAVSQLSGIEEAQLINYLRVTGYEIGLLLNLGTQTLQYRRFVLTKSVKSAESAD